ncbi:MAG TPA: ATP-binding protein [Thermoleophilaceae bacterium]|jgi:two-component system sensor histidine kinase KdpD
MGTKLRSKQFGVLVAALAVAATTIVIYPLRKHVPAVSTGPLYLLGVLLVSSYWGLGLGVVTAVASATAFNFFHLPPTGRFTISNPQNWLALGVYFAAAVVVSTLADAARARAIEAERGRREADLAAELARVILGGSDPAEALPDAGRRIADLVGLEWAQLELGWVDGDEQRTAIALVSAGDRVGTLLVPRSTAPDVADEIERRIAPSLSALVSAALRRERLEAQLVETKALRRSDVMKTALLRAVSHDLRSPLTAIRTAAAGVGSTTVSDEERAEMAAVIAGESDRLSRLIENLLDLSRLEAGTLEPRRDWYSLEEVVESAAEGIRAPLDVQVEPELPLLQGDSTQLERALGNLLENAARYSDGSPVAVRVSSVGRRIFIRVSDSGPGIPKEELGHIFEPFYRMEGAPSGGSGLGLAIARGFVEANGGRLRAQSLPGQGATFVIDLPLPEQAPAPTEA